jgi:hypothetical protein
MVHRTLVAWLKAHRRTSWWLGIGSGFLTALLALAYLAGYGEGSTPHKIGIGVATLLSFVVTGWFLTLAEQRPPDSYRW